MDHTPQPESKHDSEVPIFSVSTAEEDDDVEEYVEEEEYEVDDDPRTMEEVSQDMSTIEDNIKTLRKGLNAALQAIEDRDKANKLHRSKMRAELTALASKVEMVRNDQSTANDDITSLNAKLTQVEHTQEVNSKTIDRRLDQIEKDHETEVATRTASSNQLKKGQEDLTKALGIIETQQQTVKSLPTTLQEAFKNALVRAFQELHTQGLFSPPAGTPIATQAQPPTQGGQVVPAGTMNPVACNQFIGLPRESYPPDSQPNIHGEKQFSNWVSEHRLSSSITPEYAVYEMFLHSSTHIPIETVLYYIVDGFYAADQNYNVEYEKMVAQAETHCPTFYDTQTDGKVYYIVSAGQILHIGTDGRLYYEQELVKLAAQFPPSPFRDITQTNSAFFDSCTHLNPETFQAYCRDLAILLIRFCTPLDKADEYKVPFLYDIRRALHLPLQGSQLLMFVWSKLTSYAPQNLAQIITALKSLISRTLETYRPSTDPIYLLLFLTSVIDQTIHLRPPHVIDGKIVFDQLLVTLFRYFTSADALDSSKGWHSMVAKILDARSNNKAYNADILDYAKFQDVHGMKRQLMAAAATMGHQFTKTGECPPYLACRDLLKEVKDSMFNQNQTRGRSKHRTEHDRNPSRETLLHALRKAVGHVHPVVPGIRQKHHMQGYMPFLLKLYLN